MNNYNQAAMCWREQVSLIDAYLLAIFLGFFGAHYFYLERFNWGLLYLLTLGLFGVGWLIDIFRLPCLVSRFPYDRFHLGPPFKHLDDAYVLWISGGFLGMLGSIVVNIVKQ